MVSEPRTRRPGEGHPDYLWTDRSTINDTRGGDGCPLSTLPTPGEYYSSLLLDCYDKVDFFVFLLVIQHSSQISSLLFFASSIVTLGQDSYRLDLVVSLETSLSLPSAVPATSQYIRMC